MSAAPAGHLRQEHAVTLQALGNTLCFILSQDRYFEPPLEKQDLKAIVSKTAFPRFVWTSGCGDMLQ